MKCRLIACLICLTLLLGMIPSAAAYSGVSSWAQEEMEKAQAAGLIPESLEDADVSQAMTRQEMCDLAVAMLGQLTGHAFSPENTKHFSDTTSSNVNIASELGIVNGYPDGTFLPNNNITRQEFAKILVGVLSALKWDEYEINLSQFTDSGDIADWARESAATVVNLGIVEGKGGGALNPLDGATREQALCVMLRCYKLLLAQQHLALSLPEQMPEGSYQCSEWAREQIEIMDLCNLIPKSLQGKDLRQKITRLELTHAAVTLWQQFMKGQIQPQNTGHFTDTDDVTIQMAYELGIVNGVSDTMFKPDDLLTRQQMFKIIIGMLQACGWESAQPETSLKNSFTDAAQISDWAIQPVWLLNRLQILLGNDDQTIAPKKNLSRQQGIVLTYRAYEFIKDWYAAHPLEDFGAVQVVNEKALEVVNYALSFVGYPYVYGGSNPATGFDCSGFTSYVYAHFGYTLQRTAAGQITNGINVSRDKMLPGDILIFSVAGNLNTIGHVAIYIGGGNMVHAQSTATGVCITPVSNYDARYLATRRIIY